MIKQKIEPKDEASIRWVIALKQEAQPIIEHYKMKLSSPRFKSLAVTFGFSFWFFIISTSIKYFSVEYFLVVEYYPYVQ